MKEKANKHGLLFILVGFMFVMTLTAIIPLVQPVTASEDTISQPLDLSEEPPNCRFGVATTNSDQTTKVSEFGVGWFLNFGTYETTQGNIEYVPVIRLKQDKNGETYLNSYSVTPALNDSGLGAKIDELPGATWIVGNEPDRGPNPRETVGGQDDMQPEMYARAYHDVYAFIKNRDPQAKVAIAGLVQVTPNRLQYLDRIWAEYERLYGEQMPVDVWNMHLYILPEVNPNGEPNGIANIAVGTDPALGMKESGGDSSLCGNLNNGVYCFADHDNMDFFKDQIVAMRTWMKEHGQQNKPLILTEYSLLYPYEDTNGDGTPDFLRDEYGQLFPPTRVNNFLRNSFAYLGDTGIDTNLGYPQDGYRLVQQSLWFSVYYSGPGSASSLYTNESLSTISNVGLALKNEMSQRANEGLKPNLRPINAANIGAFVIAPSTTATVTLSVGVFNNGDTGANSPFTVTFYSDQSLTNVIDQVDISDNLYGCARGPLTVAADWSGLTPGVHRYWVKVDSGSTILESNENDNVTSGIVIIDPEQTFLPILVKD